VILLDTTILVYAVGTDHALQQPCSELLELVAEGSVRATTTLEVIQEFTHIRALRRTRGDAAALGKNYAIGLAPLVQPELDDLLDGLELFRRVTSLRSFDAVLAVVARRRGWLLASADRAFARVGGLTHLNPASSSFLEVARAAN
jgi:predicted nucleic acid-binding protein